MRQIKAVLFDLGNTLLYFDGDFGEMLLRADKAGHAALEELGIKVDPETFLPEVRKQLSTYYQEREKDLREPGTISVLAQYMAEWGYPDLPEETLAEVMAKFYAVSQAQWIPEEDALPTLQALQERGIRMGIISNAGNDKDVQLLVDKGQLRPYMDFVLTSVACGTRKPGTAIFDQALANWDLPRDQVAMVGDTLHADIAGGQQAGLFSVWIKRRADTEQNQKNRETIAPDATINTLTELLTLF